MTNYYDRINNDGYPDYIDDSGWQTVVDDDDEYLSGMSDGDWQDYELAKEFEQSWLDDSLNTDDYTAPVTESEPVFTESEPVVVETPVPISGIEPETSESDVHEQSGGATQWQIETLRNLALAAPTFTSIARAAENYSYSEAQAVINDITRYTNNNPQIIRKFNQKRTNKPRGPRAK